MKLLKFSSALIPSIFCSLLCTIPAYSKSAWTEVEKPLAFNDVNELLHKNYAHAKDEIREALGPIILCTSDSISLLKGGDKTTVTFITTRNTALKQIAHITLGTFIILTNHTDENLNKDTLERLQTYKFSIEAAANKLQQDQGLETRDTPKQQALIKQTLSFLSSVVEGKRVSHADLLKFVHSCAAPDLENAYQSAGSQITVVDQVLTKWHGEMTSEDWNKLHVIIWTAHMPRQGLLSYQYFCKLLDQSLEGSKIIVAESPAPCNDEQAVDLLLTHILDGKVARDFFQDPWRMHRDLLSDGATQWLEEHQLKAAGKASY